MTRVTSGTVGHTTGYLLSHGNLQGIEAVRNIESGQLEQWVVSVTPVVRKTDTKHLLMLH